MGFCKQHRCLPSKQHTPCMAHMWSPRSEALAPIAFPGQVHQLPHRRLKMILSQWLR
jgi:hypothetical protein